MFDPRNRPALIVQASLLALLAIACIVCATARGIGGTPDTTANHSPRVCFPTAKWGPAPARYAPCVKVTRVYEDGSFSFAVSDKGGTVRYTSGVGALDR